MLNDSSLIRLAGQSYPPKSSLIVAADEFATIARIKMISTDIADHGVIIPDRLYTFQAFERITGIGKAGLRSARRNGLEVRYFGRQGYVLGRTVIDFIVRNGAVSR